MSQFPGLGVPQRKEMKHVNMEEYEVLMENIFQNPDIPRLYNFPGRGAAANSNIQIIQRLESIILRKITVAPRYISSHQLHQDLDLETVHQSFDQPSLHGLVADVNHQYQSYVYRHLLEGGLHHQTVGMDIDGLIRREWARMRLDITSSLPLTPPSIRHTAWIEWPYLGDISFFVTKRDNLACPH